MPMYLYGPVRNAPLVRVIVVKGKGGLYVLSILRSGK